MTNPLVYLDTETTNLNPRTGDVIEVAWAVDDGPIRVCVFPHSLVSADPAAFRVNGYYDRALDRYATAAGYPPAEVKAPCMVRDLIRDLTGATIVAENYGFDAAFLHAKLGFEPWHHRKIELSTAAMIVFNLDRPEGIAKTADRLRGEGFVIPVPDHTAAGDVAALRACYTALRDLRPDYLSFD